jgi:hypothetical protein
VLNSGKAGVGASSTDSFVLTSHSHMHSLKACARTAAACVRVRVCVPACLCVCACLPACVRVCVPASVCAGACEQGTATNSTLVGVRGFLAHQVWSAPSLKLHQRAPSRQADATTRKWSESSSRFSRTGASRGEAFFVFPTIAGCRGCRIAWDRPTHSATQETRCKLQVSNARGERAALLAVCCVARQLND